MAIIIEAYNLQLETEAAAARVHTKKVCDKICESNKFNTPSYHPLPNIVEDSKIKAKQTKCYASQAATLSHSCNSLTSHNCVILDATSNQFVFYIGRERASSRTASNVARLLLKIYH